VEEATYTTGQAAKILKVSDSYLRRLVRSGELEALQDEVNGRYLIPQRAVHAMLELRRSLPVPRHSGKRGTAPGGVG
jgi:excisionase family DNA binding protein